MQQLCVGIDVSKDKFDCVVRDSKNRRLFGPREYDQNNDGMLKMKEDIEQVAEKVKAGLLLACESTGIYHLPLVEFCDRHGLSIEIFNALEITKYHRSRIRKQRTDPIDADTIARALVIEGHPLQKVKIPKVIKNLRELARVRKRLVDQVAVGRTRLKRDMDIICRGYSRCFSDILCPTSRAVLKKCVQLTAPFKRSEEELAEILKKARHPNYWEKAKELRALFDRAIVPVDLLEACIVEIKFLLKQHAFLTEHIEKMERRIERLVETLDTPITSIPGIKAVNAGIILGEIGDIDRFDHVDQLVAFSGLDPSKRESGQYDSPNRHISKRGSPYLRSALYMSALSARTSNPVCKAFADRLKKKGKKPKVIIVAVARKLLTIVYSVLKNNREFYVPESLRDK